MIGMFAVAEILRNVVSTQKMEPPRMERLLNVFAGVGRTLVKYCRGLMRGNIIGTAIGILLGAGGDIAAWATYALRKKMWKEPEKSGSGLLEAGVDAGTAKHAPLRGAFNPAQPFGIPRHPLPPPRTDALPYTANKT